MLVTRMSGDPPRVLLLCRYCQIVSRRPAQCCPCLKHPPTLQKVSHSHCKCSDTHISHYHNHIRCPACALCCARFHKYHPHPIRIDDTTTPAIPLLRSLSDGLLSCTRLFLRYYLKRPRSSLGCSSPKKTRDGSTICKKRNWLTTLQTASEWMAKNSSDGSLKVPRDP
jgi:hypothetical protein